LVRSSFLRTAESAVRQKVQEKVNEAKQQIDTLTVTAVEAAQTSAPNAAQATAAAGTGEAAKGTLDEINSIIGSLPEVLRLSWNWVADNGNATADRIFAKCGQDV
jgi:hypothetical protein